MSIHPQYKRIHRKTIIIAFSSIAVGLLGALIPFLPGTVFVLLGASLLSVQSRFAFTIFAFIRARYPKLADAVKKTETRLVDFFNLTTHKRQYILIPHHHNKRDISLLIEQSEFVDTPVVILLHGASTIPESSFMETVARNYKRQGLTVIRFSAHNSLDDEQGNFLHFTAKEYEENLATVIAWAKTQPWFKEPFMLFGHSVGALVAGWYAAKNPLEIKQLTLLFPTLSGEIYVRTLEKNYANLLQNWKERGYRIIEHPLTKKEHRLSYAFVENLLSYDLHTFTSILATIPTTVIASMQDAISVHKDSYFFCKQLGECASLITLHHIPHIPTTFDELHELQQGLALIPLQSYPSHD